MASRPHTVKTSPAFQEEHQRPRQGKSGRLTSIAHCNDGVGMHSFNPTTISKSMMRCGTAPAVFAATSQPPRGHGGGSSGVNFVPWSTRAEPPGGDEEAFSGGMKWYMNRAPDSLSRASFTDVSVLRAVAQPHKIYHDYNKEQAWRVAVAGGPPMTANSISREQFRDLSGHKAALKPAGTVYTEKEEMRKVRAAMEKKQLMMKKTGRGLRPTNQTSSDNLRTFSAQEMVDARTPPTFTGWHESTEPFCLEEPWTPSVECAAFAVSPGSTQRSRAKRFASSSR